MSLLGDLFGYSEYGHDILGTHRDESQNCPACGMSAILHSPEQQMTCLASLFRTPAEDSK